MARRPVRWWVIGCGSVSYTHLDVYKRQPLTAADLAGRWALDFHTPHGLVPLAYDLVDDLAAGAVAAARERCV